MAGSIFIPLVSVFDAKGIREAKTGMAALAGTVKNLKGAAVAAAASFAAVGITGFVKESVTEARNLERNLVGLGNVFESATPGMQQFAKDATAIGLSQVEASRASTFLGSVLKQSGFEMGTVSKETKNLVGLASDLAATYGYDVSEALTGMTALFRGEYDPIEKFGVAMKQSEVNAVLAARGQNKLTGAALRNATAQARLDMLYERSRDAQGAYAEQSGSLFVAQTQLAASFDNLKASLGESLTGPLATLLSSIVPIVDIMGKVLAPIFETLGKYIAHLAPVIATLAEVFLIVFEAISPLIDVLFELIGPLLNPLAAIFKLLVSVIKPFIPLITFLANVLGAVLLPIVTGLNIGFKLLVDGMIAFFNFLGSIPFIGDAFRGVNSSLESLNDQMSGVNDKMLVTSDNANLMTSSLSKKIDSNPVDSAGKAIEKTGGKAQKASGKIKQFLEDALGIQKSFIDATNITGLLDENTEQVITSMVYINGQFKKVVSNATKSSTDIVSVFKGKLLSIKNFYKDISRLDALGLDAELIQQISSAGVEAGGATAKAILETGTEGITSLNKTFAGIKQVSGNIGYKVAQDMQDTGASIGNGLIDGLIAQSAKLTSVAETMGKSFADGFDAGLNKKKVPEVTKLIPKGYSYAASTFLGSKKAMAEGQTDLSANGYKLMLGKDVKNPFTGLSNPLARGTKQSGGTFQEFKDWAAANAAKQQAFQANINKATEYKIAINVAPGASVGAINDALIAAIQEYERKKGKLK